MRFHSIRLGGFRAHTLALDLPAVGVITGPNGCGKSSLADGIVLATTQRLPGRTVDRDGIASLDVLADATGGAGKWDVVLTDTEGVEVTFGFVAGEARSSRELRLSTCSSKRNEEIRRAIAQRYGSEAAGPTLLDLEAIRTMPPDEMERLVLRLCGGASHWTVPRVLSELAIRASNRAKPETMETLQLSSHLFRNELEHIKLSNEVREVFGELAEHIREQKREARSAVLATTKLLEQELPAAPTEAELGRLEADASAAHVADSHARERFAEARSRARVAREQADRQKAEHTRELERVQREGAAQEGAYGRAAAAADAAQREHREAEERVGLLRDQLELLGAHGARKPQGPTDSEFEAARRSVTDAQRELDTLGPAPLELHPDFDGALAQVRADRQVAADRLREVTSSLAEARADLRAGEERADRFADGRCPECGQSVEQVLDATQTDVAQLRTRVAELEQAEQEITRKGLAARDRIQVFEAKAKAVAAAEEQRRRRVDDVREQLARATNALHELELRAERARQDQDAAGARLEAERTALTQRIADAERTVHEAERRVDMARDAKGQEHGRLEHMRREFAAARSRTADADFSVVDRDVEEADRALKEAVRVSDDAFRVLHEARGRRAAVDELLHKQEQAEQERVIAQARGNLWAATEAASYELEREVLESLVSPVVAPVNKLAQAYGLGLGTFAARFGRRFQLGWETADGFAPLASLSAGHCALTLLCLSATLHRLAESPCRVVILDGGEALDRTNRPAFGKLARWLHEKGHLDQVLVCAVDGSGWGLPTVELAQTRLAA